MIPELPDLWELLARPVQRVQWDPQELPDRRAARDQQVLKAQLERRVRQAIRAQRVPPGLLDRLVAQDRWDLLALLAQQGHRAQ